MMKSRLEKCCSDCPNRSLKTHLLMRVDNMNKWTDFSDEVVAISRAIAVAQTQPTTDGHWSSGQGEIRQGR